MKEVYFLALQFSRKKQESIFRATVLRVISIHQSIQLCCLLFIIGLLFSERNNVTEPFDPTAIGHPSERQSYHIDHRCDRKR